MIICFSPSIAQISRTLLYLVHLSLLVQHLTRRGQNVVMISLGQLIDLSAINSQDALILLRSSFSAPKVRHLLRCSPPVSHNSLEKFDELLRRLVQRITNRDLSDSQWIQASLPVKRLLQLRFDFDSALIRL